MTETGFLEWQRAQELRYELVDGVPRAMTGAEFRHDRVLGNAFAMLLDALERLDSPCRPFTADIVVRVPTGNLRRPDVAVYCPPFDEDAMVSDRPRLVIEVLSESSEDTDQYVKADEYQHLEALDYILLIAPRVVDVLVWSREDDRSWRSTRYRPGAARVTDRWKMRCRCRASAWRWDWHDSIAAWNCVPGHAWWQRNDRSQNDRGAGSHHWAFDEADDLVLTVANGNAFVIPPRAFASPVEQADFHEFARRSIAIEQRPSQ